MDENMSSSENLSTSTTSPSDILAPYSPDALDKPPGSVPLSSSSIEDNGGVSPRSLKETLVGGAMDGTGTDVLAWINAKMVSVGFVDENRTIPKISFSKELLDVLSRP